MSVEWKQVVAREKTKFEMRNIARKGEGKMGKEKGGGKYVN